MAAGFGLAALYALTVIRLRANQIVAGTAINMLAAGVAPFVCKVLYGVTGSTPGIPIDDRFHIAPVFMAFALVALVHLWAEYTPSGLWVKFAGEHPQALDTAGIRVNRVRWAGVLMSGVLAGLGGAALSTFLSSSYSKNMTAGRGFMALAALIFGKPLDALDPDQQHSVGSSRAALRQGALSLFALRYLSSLNIESIDYDPGSQIASLKYKLAEGTTLNVSQGTGGGQPSAGIRKRLSKHMAVTTTLNNPSPTQADRTVSTFLEWAYQY